ncbi:hypothetical protein E2C01_029819 [Portunus trituberculatus]|uniref:Uncharacterized protein n=1 Tax=Portunus trituberculatus TaxID=210409 RepID=A0A5B7EVL0_PORTR|nr:hypothetical protein [Portunus trituberculatus]
MAKSTSSIFEGTHPPASPILHHGLIKWHIIKAAYSFIEDLRTHEDIILYVLAHVSELSRCLQEKGTMSFSLSIRETRDLRQETWKLIFACIYISKAVVGVDQGHLQDLSLLLLQDNHLSAIQILLRILATSQHKKKKKKRKKKNPR